MLDGQKTYSKNRQKVHSKDRRPNPDCIATEIAKD